MTTKKIQKKSIAKTKTSKKITKSQKKTRYTDPELEEFKKIIVKKLKESRQELKYLQNSIMNANEHGTDDTNRSFKSFEDAPTHMEKEYLHQIAERQRQFTNNLEKALIRIENKTYGICRETGKLISKQRLKSVPHATLSIDAKLNQTKN